jgi:hypothetical protein
MINRSTPRDMDVVTLIQAWETLDALWELDAARGKVDGIGSAEYAREALAPRLRAIADSALGPRSNTEVASAADELAERLWRVGHAMLGEPSEGRDADTRIRAKYGDDDVRADPFALGMLSGKLSALRWVLGDEWDNLDT